jgi:hypothetical protein|tara:strand:+ start:584 stop:724 length:141 start_codon:yes stop_codon:yes gene_type:complete
MRADLVEEAPRRAHLWVLGVLGHHRQPLSLTPDLLRLCDARHLLER